MKLGEYKVRCCTKVIACSFLTLLLTGCEAPLNLAAVEAQRAQSIQRIDFYQSMVANGDELIAVGNNGLVISSADGEVWQRQILEGAASLLTVDACPSGETIALSFDNNLWLKQPQASQWQSIAIPTNEQLMDVTCAPDGSWWVAGSFSTIMHSTDSGANWQTFSLQEDAIITNIAFLNDTDAVASAEYGMILSSTDGGQNWDVTGYLPDEFYPHGMYFTSLESGWISGLNGYIYATEDGGETWTKETVDTAVPVYQLVAANDQLLGLGENTTVLRRNAAGSWTTIVSPSAPVYLRAVATSADGVTHVAGGRGVYLALTSSMTGSKE